MKALSTVAAVALAAGALMAPAGASAAESKSVSNAPCFFVSQWRGWTAPNDDTLYLRVSRNQIYKVQVSGGARQLRSPGAFLVSESRGGSVCSHMDLDLIAADSGGFRAPLIARSLVRLTPEEVAKLPKSDLP